MDDEQVDVRVGDRERKALDERLQKAMAEGRLTSSEYEERSASCWAARTRRELNELTRDLPDPEPEPDDEAPKQPAEPTSAGNDSALAVSEQTKSLGSRIFGSIAVTAVALFLGSQVLLAEDGPTIFGSKTVHAPKQGEVEVGVLFGSVEVIVPEGVSANSTGAMIFGSVDCQAACGEAGESQLSVSGRGAFGSVEIMTPQEQRAMLEEDD